MTTELHPTDRDWFDDQMRTPDPTRPPRRRAHGLRMPAIPTWALLAQMSGFGATLSGVYLQFGIAVTLIVGGLAAVLLGMLREAGKI